ncbi:MAG: hypothetical protein H0A76_12775 [Candidatus Thiodubiliella endoseptemdiera]|uniref:Uncharacterized protein n=1 Tax=Candidatus Thiodubiliella endoseptemdiera TaxID=2738886 RepID=A0A853F3R9_9GAMM|nr:hypothetical protein [Candidatus Thiodubiliella endoseptemdiera]
MPKVQTMVPMTSLNHFRYSGTQDAPLQKTGKPMAPKKAQALNFAPNYEIYQTRAQKFAFRADDVFNPPFPFEEPPTS